MYVMYACMYVSMDGCIGRNYLCCMQVYYEYEDTEGDNE
jgi:hypothetical protein